MRSTPAEGSLEILDVHLIRRGDNLPRLEAVLESEHFEVRVYPGVIIHADMLDNLEEHYRVTQDLLKFPEVKVIYSLFASIADVDVSIS